MKEACGHNKFVLKILILIILLGIFFFISFFVGHYPILPKTVVDIILSNFINIHQYWDDNLATVVMDVRLPRIVIGILVGGALSVSGASYQTLFKNPMAAPDILGVSAGAGFGAALAMINNGNWFNIQLLAFTFGLIAVGSAYIIANVFSKQSITVLILAGIVVSGFFQALLAIIKTLADTESQLPSITFWLMGSLSKVSNNDIKYMLPAIIITLVILLIYRHQINALAAGEDEALTMGVNVSRIKIIIVCCATFMTVTAVSTCGIIGWIGMVVPHIARMVTGPNYSKLSITSFLIGGIFLLGIDNVVRGFDGVDLPLGALTALIGTPVFVGLLSRVRKGWS